MTNKRTKRLPKIILGQFSVLFLICVVALILVFYSQGYKFDWKYLRVYKTGMVLLVTDPIPDHILINGTEEGNSTEFTKTFVPGYYDIEITKDGYQNWQRSILIEAEKLKSFKNIELFRDNPAVTDLSNQSKIDFLNAPNSYLAENSKNDIVSNDYEIWVNGALLTRFSSKINSPIWYTDNDHIVFQTGNEIRVIERAGFNNTLLVTLSSDAPTKFALGNRGIDLYFLDGSVYKQATIR